MKYLNLKALATFSLVLPTVFLTGCQKENAFDCFKNTGSITTEVRTLAPFHTIRLFDNLNVTLVPDTAFWAEVKAGDHLQENIRTEVKQGELWIQNINKCNWVRSYRKPLEVWVHTPRVSTIHQDGDGTFRSQGILPADTLFLHLIGAGDLDLTVNTSYLWLDMYELGDLRIKGDNKELVAQVLSFGSLNAPDLTNQIAYLKLTGEGHARVQAEQFLGAEITGNGNVYYRDQPRKIERSGNGKGQLLKAD